MSGYTLDRKNRQIDFEALELDDGLSIDRRPDAVSFDYLTAFGLGPRRIQDVSAGMVERPWRARAVGNDIYLARASDDGTSWVDEQLLFSIEGEPPIEIDLAFDQQGRAVVCVERETGDDGEKHIWLYWYDPVVADFAFTDFGPGWSPRILMDDPIETTESDLQLFYFREGFGLARREQRDRYETEYSTPVSEWENLFVEDAGYIKWLRFAVLYSKRNPGNGQYEIQRIESKLYPYRFADSVTIGATKAISGSLVFAMFFMDQEPEGIEIGVAMLPSSDLQPSIIVVDPDTESVLIDPSLESGALLLALLFNDMEAEGVHIEPALQLGDLHFYLIYHDASDYPDTFEISPTLQSGSLSIP